MPSSSTLVNAVVGKAAGTNSGYAMPSDEGYGYGV